MKTPNLFKSNYQTIADNKFAHNIKNNLFVVLGYLQFGEYDKAETKIKELCKTSIDKKFDYITNNKIIDTFLNMKINQAEQHDIKCFSNKLPKGILSKRMKFCTDMDICQAIGSALDNAIEYLSKIDNIEHKKIKMEFTFKDNILSCKISNYIKSGYEINSAAVKTSKENPSMHGFGITTMIEITTRYHGELSFNQENNTLTTILSFKIPK